jgi:selenocysteine lyase/cysteine desulfurase
MQRVAAHNASLASYFSRQLAQIGLRTIGGSQRIGRSWKWSGIAVLLNVPGSVSQELAAEDGFRFSHLNDEPWRQAALGGVARGPRYSLSIKLGEADAVEADFQKVELEEQASPVPFGGCARFCFHYYHRKSDVDRLVRAFAEKL